MSREAHVQFCESLGVRFPGATHPEVIGSSVGLVPTKALVGSGNLGSGQIVGKPEVSPHSGSKIVYYGRLISL